MVPFSAKLFPNFTMVAKDTRLRPAEGGPGGGQGEWQPGRGGAQPGGLRTPTRCPRLVSRERWQGRGDRSPSEFPGCVLMGISRLPSRRAPGSAQRGEGGNATRAQPFRSRPQSRRAGLLSVSRGPQRERCSAARPTPHPHSPHAWLRKVWAPSALRGSASPAPACSNGGGGAAAGGSAIGFCASRLRAPPPSCRSRGPRAGVRVGPRRCASALTQRRPRANRPHKGARGCGGGGSPGDPARYQTRGRRTRGSRCRAVGYPCGLRNPGAVAEHRAVGREQGKGRDWETCKASEPQREEERVAVHSLADLRILKNDKGFRRTVLMTDLGGP